MILKAEEGSYWFKCLGCRRRHAFFVVGPLIWEFDGNMEEPTFSPSLSNKWNTHDSAHHCHLFVKKGKIEYCADSTHHLAGKTVDMVSYNG